MKNNKIRAKNTLSIVITPDQIAAAELSDSSDGPKLIKYAEYNRRVSVNLDELGEEKDAFIAFLKQNRFKFKNAAVGISSRNVLTTLVDVSKYADADRDVFTSAVQLDLEQRFEFDVKDAVFDCVPLAGNSNHILAAAVLNRDIQSVRELFAGTGISLVSLSVSLLAPRLHREPGVCVNLILYPHHTGFVVFEDSCLQTLKCLPSGSTRLGKTAPAVAELKRLLLTMQNTQGISCRIWGSESPAEEVVDSFKKVIPDTRFERISRPSQLEWITVSLGERILDGGCELDFVNTHFGTHKKKRSGWSGRIIAASLLVLAFAAVFFGGWYMDSRDAEAAEQQYADLSERLETAQSVIQRVSQARPWFSSRTYCLSSLKELTLCFPEYPHIWLSSLALDENFNQVISGSAVSENAVLDVVEAMNSSSGFSNIKILYLRKMNKNSDTVTFAVNFKYERDN
ncbi:PilN domain-containing protein [Limihaloglobus sulfuriphilus]|uniref:PilN domain-containing protein n=1 Tax=Limihaloglobus sulfuriphilus TaxID=1851148 RepID=UPI0011BAE1E7|nr:PilN domain-containing protein [Limihaloglobus sulfuriphilus]